MAIIDSVKLPDNSTYEVADNHSGYQKQTLTTPLTINGTQETTVEGALGGLNDYGDALADNLAANENVYGAKNTWDYTRFVTCNGGFTQSNGVYTNTLTDTRTSFQITVKAYDSNSTDLGSVINEIITGTGIKELPASIPNNTAYLRIAHNGLGQDFTFYQPITQTGDVILSFDVTSNDPTTVGGLSFTDVMLRDARITDPTFAPYAETNLQLTQNKAERNDLSTIHATGSTNTTGAQIKRGKFFYLNGVYCKATLNIGTGDTFTLNTNYKTANIGDETPTFVKLNVPFGNVTAGSTYSYNVTTNYPFITNDSIVMWSYEAVYGSVKIDFTGNVYVRPTNDGLTLRYTAGVTQNSTVCNVYIAYKA